MNIITIPSNTHYQYYADAQHTTFVVQSHATVKIVTILEAQCGDVHHTMICHDYSNVQYECIITSGNHAVVLDVQLLGVHAQATINGACTASEQETITITSTQAHHAAHTKSELHIKGALAGHAQMKYDGAIYVAASACQTQAAQKNITLLLSDYAQAVSNPSLEVLTNDVQCAHGSAVGQLDEQQLFYLQARGMDYQQARKVLMQGFFADHMHHHNLVAAVDRILAKDHQ